MNRIKYTKKRNKRSLVIKQRKDQMLLDYNERLKNNYYKRINKIEEKERKEREKLLKKKKEKAKQNAFWSKFVVIRRT